MALSACIDNVTYLGVAIHAPADKSQHYLRRKFKFKCGRQFVLSILT